MKLTESQIAANFIAMGLISHAMNYAAAHRISIPDIAYKMEMSPDALIVELQQKPLYNHTLSFWVKLATAVGLSLNLEMHPLSPPPAPPTNAK